MSDDRITLTLPRERPFYGVASLVIGGLAARLDLSYDELEDLQVALTELLAQRQRDGHVTVAVSVRDGAIEASVGPFEPQLTEELARDLGEGVGLRRVLETVVDEVEVTERDGAPWVSLRKNVVARAGSGR